MFELLDQTNYLEHIPMLKDREKLIEQDAIWKKICDELDWEFIATFRIEDDCEMHMYT